MFLPYGTDAPVYHWPYTTVALIVINTAALVGLYLSPESAPTFVLAFGDGLHPLQWVTANFVHAGIMHLLGNMLALWTFGLVVEGKLGWWKTLVIYLGIGAVECAFVQVVMLGASEGGACGASGIIFGFMAMSLIWAPENDVQLVMLLAFYPIFFEWKISVMVGVMLALQFGVFLLTDMSMSSEALHLTGAAIGLPLAIWMLRRKLVDCENWDIFSVRAGRHRMTAEERAREEAARPENRRRVEETKRLRNETARAEFHRIVAEGKIALAVKVHQQLLQKQEGWCLSESELLGLIQACHTRRLWSDSVPLMVEYLSRFTEKAIAVRLKLAQILVTADPRPAQSLRVLAKLDVGCLDLAQRTLAAKIRVKAEQMHLADPYEVVEEDWA